MKDVIRNKGYWAAPLTILCLLLLAACSLFLACAEADEEQTGTVAISIGGASTSNSVSRTAQGGYPPSDNPGNPGASGNPAIGDLSFDVYFDNSAAPAGANVKCDAAFSFSLAATSHTVRVKVYETISGKRSLYATGSSSFTLDSGQNDMIIVPVYQAITVTFDLDYSGAPSPSTSTVQAGQGDKISAPDPAPTRAGYSFAGWYTDNTAYTKQWNFSTDTVPSFTPPTPIEDLDLYAKWGKDAATPVINTQPANASISKGTAATLTIAVASVTDGGTLTYQWYSSTTASNTGGTPVSGAAGTSFTTPQLNASGNYYYYCVVTNTNNGAEGAKTATAVSNVATVTVDMAWTDVTAANNPFTNTIDAIAYGNGKFVAVGEYGKMAYSTNGVGWTEPTNSVFTSNIHAIAYGNGTFVACDDYNMSYSSDGGVSWSPLTSSTLGNQVHGIAYGAGKFVAVANNARMAKSSDGATWTAITSHPFTSHICAIVYANGKFIAGGSNGKIAYSSDGDTWYDDITWTGATGNPFGTDQIKAIAYGDGKFVAGGGHSGTSGDAGKMALSTDGVTWTAVTSSTFSGSQISAIAYGETAAGNGKFVAGGGNYPIGGTTFFSAWSTDGINWTSISTGLNVHAIAYGNGRFVAGGHGSFPAGYPGKLVYSED